MYRLGARTFLICDWVWSRCPPSQAFAFLADRQEPSVNLLPTWCPFPRGVWARFAACSRSSRHLPTAAKPARSAYFFGVLFGAGEGIRTLDPDLGKVVLYP